MKQQTEEHNRLQLLRSNVKTLCRSHGVQRVIDFFPNENEGNTVALECGCRRKEKL